MKVKKAQLAIATPGKYLQHRFPLFIFFLLVHLNVIARLVQLLAKYPDISLDSVVAVVLDEADLILKNEFFVDVFISFSSLSFFSTHFSHSSG